MQFTAIVATKMPSYLPLIDRKERKMHTQTSPQDHFKDFLKVAVPAVIMPLIFTVIPGWIMSDEALLRMAWSVIAPSSLFGALCVVYFRPAAMLVNGLLTRSTRVAAACTGGAAIALLAFVLGALASQVGGLDPSLASDIAMSAGIGALAAILTVFPIQKS